MWFPFWPFPRQIGGAVAPLVASDLQGHDAREPLDLIEESIALLEDLLVLRVLGVGTGSLDDACDSVNLGRDPAIGDEAGELAIQERRGDAEDPGHAFESDALVGSEELVVSSEPHLTQVERSVLAQEPILHYGRVYGNESFHKVLIAALVERIEEV
jgi:hypothetical protein